MKLIKQRVFKTKDKTILIVKVERREGVTITASEISPLKYDDAVEMNRQQLEDDPELWREAVQAGRTELGLSEWIDYVIKTDGETCMIDNSLYPEMIDVNGVDYIFESFVCGCMHDEILAVWPEAQVFVDGHLVEMHGKANFIYNYEQEHKRKPAPAVVDMHMLEVERKHKASLEAYDRLSSDDVDTLVEAYAKQIINNL